MAAQAPVLNINGASADSLVEGHIKVWRLIRETKAALAEITPHGRDFQTVDKAVYDRAREEHFARMVQLDKIEREICEIVVDIQNQQASRARH